jgi:hypothetical protein
MGEQSQGGRKLPTPRRVGRSGGRALNIINISKNRIRIRRSSRNV